MLDNMRPIGYVFEHEDGHPDTGFRFAAILDNDEEFFETQQEAETRLEQMRDERHARASFKGKLKHRTRPNCEFCRRYGHESNMPSHDASDRCESGKRPHCTCDRCF